MTKNTYVLWEEVLTEVEQIADDLDNVCTLASNKPIDRSHPVAERIRQLGRDMEAPTGPVVGERKEE